jgi:predicted nucleotidyltransferase
VILNKLKEKGLILPPHWLPTNTQYLTIMGSVAYGVSSNSSDNDIYGFCIPPKDDVFPHLRGEVPGFGKQVQRFECWEEHHIFDGETQKEYDLTVYSIVKYFQLCMQNNPNMIDSLFTPRRCVLHSTQIGEMVRENRKMFLHKGCWHRFKGYAYSQLNKMKNRNPQGKRKALIEKHGYDTKFAYHIPRLLHEVEMIMVEGDLDLQRNREQLKAIRRGEWTKEEVLNYCQEKEIQLEAVYNECTLPYGPDENKIKGLLLNCLEHHYGSLDRVIHAPDRYESALREISEICRKTITT